MAERLLEVKGLKTYFYTDEGVTRLATVLRPGGVVALWSPEREPELMQRLHALLSHVAEVVVPVEVDGVASLDYVYRARCPPRATESSRTLN